MLTRHRHALLKVLLALFCFVALAFSLAIPAHADDRSYSIDRVQIDATVDEDGTLHVSEKRTYNFDGNFNGVYQRLARLPKGSIIRVEGLSVECSGERDDLPEIPFDTYWRDNPASAPSGHYSFDRGNLTVYAFKQMGWETCDITFNYHVTNAVQFYDDTAELYWKFIGDEWDEPNHSINARVTLPIPAGEKAAAGDNVLIYGHGPLSGDISLSAGVVHAYVPEAGDGDFAEMRVLFPRDWAKPASDGVNVHSGKHIEEAKAEEQEYIDAPIRHARYATIGSRGVSIAALIGALIVFFRYGREYRPEFKEKYWRDVPARDVHPAIVTRIWRWNNASKDIPVTLMHLSEIGAIRLLDVSGPQYAPYNALEQFAIVRVPDFKGELTEIDERVMDFLFETVATEAWKAKKIETLKSKKSGTDLQWRICLVERMERDTGEVEHGLKSVDVVFFSDFKYVAKKESSEFTLALYRVTKNIDERVEAMQPFEKSGATFTSIFGIVAFMFWAAAFMLWIFMSALSIWVPIWLAIVGCVFIVFAFFMRKRTPRGNEIIAKSKALKRWLEDFSLLDERPITDVKLWGELMVYAAAFGVADKALEQLRSVVPSVVSDSDFATGAGVWVGSGASSDSPFDTVSSSVSSAHMTATGSTYSYGGGGFSSNDGSGGGFSGGGGGGFGGGGGGAF